MSKLTEIRKSIVILGPVKCCSTESNLVTHIKVECDAVIFNCQLIFFFYFCSADNTLVLDLTGFFLCSFFDYTDLSPGMWFCFCIPASAIIELVTMFIRITFKVFTYSHMIHRIRRIGFDTDCLPFAHNMNMNLFFLYLFYYFFMYLFVGLFLFGKDSVSKVNRISSDVGII